MQLAPVYPLLYRVLHPLFPKCLWHGATEQKTIALTFDDGPHPQYTPKLLAVLDRYQIEASFFWLGVCVQRNPELANEVFQRGHGIGLHGYTHQSFPRLSTDELKQSLLNTQNAIADACQIDGHLIRDVRPPNGLFMPRQLRQLDQWGYRVVMWTVVPEDWVCPGISVVEERTLAQVNSGAIIVLHDGYYGGKDVAAITANLIPQLLDQGYQFVSVNEFWQQRQLTKPRN
ncbi:polysaccharide deacetylase [Gloeothece citriformis PCC 7424]|uniref:Polysaccharide deacetylase n=1 Tax=Gloeothece citriformis (strain PCC 7424) TaxID=65393 RepID=B7KDV6_GLOC7|nr:polysaccharide deacetylase family protein [Gloeothece citriformis]ACK70408.1 polysaccharide deacetylase [Gloeothece citriformis PCC 7424]